MIKIKKHNAPRFENKGKGKMETEYAVSSDSDFDLPKADKSAWARLKAKVRKTFYL